MYFSYILLPSLRIASSSSSVWSVKRGFDYFEFNDIFIGLESGLRLLIPLRMSSLLCRSISLLPNSDLTFCLFSDWSKLKDFFKCSLLDSYFLMAYSISPMNYFWMRSKILLPSLLHCLGSIFIFFSNKTDKISSMIYLSFLFHLFLHRAKI